MVAFLVILTITALLLIDYFLIRKKRAQQGTRVPVKQIPINQIVANIPDNGFLSFNLTWIKRKNGNEIVIGVHPLLLALIGEPDKITVPRFGQHISKGDPLLEITQGKRRLVVKSPIDGIVLMVNPELKEQPNYEGFQNNWILIAKPLSEVEEVMNQSTYQDKKTATVQLYNDLKKFFMELMPQSPMGETMADGGELPYGILSYFDEGVWKKFEEQYLK